MKSSPPQGAPPPPGRSRPAIAPPEPFNQFTLRRGYRGVLRRSAALCAQPCRSPSASADQSTSSMTRPTRPGHPVTGYPCRPAASRHQGELQCHHVAAAQLHHFPTRFQAPGPQPRDRSGNIGSHSALWRATRPQGHQATGPPGHRATSPQIAQSPRSPPERRIRIPKLSFASWVY